ncbi:unnamed protein product [Symbiodinium sp. CCMP2592]|nr:unnamed protein product [Symbiodinium sp. CCMP2592]
MTSKRRMEGNVLLHEAPGARVLKDEGLVYTLLMCLSLAEVRKLWKLRKMFVRVLNDKVIPLLALLEREWSIVRDFLDSNRSGFQYNLDRVFTEAVLHTDFEGLRLLAQRNYGFGSSRGDSRLKAFVHEALRSAHIERLSLLRVLNYDISEDIEECRARGDLGQLLSEGSITVDFLGSRASFRFPLMDLATSSYAEVQMTDLCKQRETLYKVPFILCAFIKAGASMSSFLRVESCGYLLLLALAAESFNFVYLLVQEAITLEAVLRQYEPYLLQMLRQAMPQRPGVLDLLCFCGFKLKLEEQEQFDSSVLDRVLKQDFLSVERISKLNFDLLAFAERQQAELSTLLQRGLEDLIGDSAEDLQTEGDSSEAKRPQLAIRRFASIDRRVLDLHFRSPQFLEFADDLMGRKAFVQMRRIVEVHPQAFGHYFRQHYQSMEELLMDAFCRRQIALVIDLTSLHLPLAQFFEKHQEELSKLERHRGALDRQLQSLDHVEDFGNEAAELAQQLRQRQGGEGAGAPGRKEGPQGRIADSIEALTALLREDVLDCQRLQAAQAVSTFEAQGDCRSVPPWGQIGFAGHDPQRLKALSTCRLFVAGAEAGAPNRGDSRKLSQDCRRFAKERSSDASDPPRLRACISTPAWENNQSTGKEAPRELVVAGDVSCCAYTEQVQLDAVLHKAWFATKAWTELVMLRSEVSEFRFKSFFLRMQDETDAAVLKILQDGYWFDLHKLAQLDFDFQDFFDRRFQEVSSAVLQFMTMPHPHFVLLRELSALDFPWERFMEEHAACILASKDQDYLQFLISLGSFEVGSKVYRVVEQTCRLYHSMANTMFNTPSSWPSVPVEAPAVAAVPCQASEASSEGLEISCDAAAPSSGIVLTTPGEAEVADESTGGAGTEGRADRPKASSATERAKELARLACERKVDAKKVMALLICRGIYCWNPLKLIIDDDGDAKDVRSWSQIESVLSFLDAKDEVQGPGPLLGLQAAQGLHAAPLQQLQQPPAAAAAANAPPQLQTLAQLQSLLQFQQIYQASPWQQQQMVIQIVCLTQRAEEHVFDKKIEPFWRGILDSVLPLERPD